MSGNLLNENAIIKYLNDHVIELRAGIVVAFTGSLLILARQLNITKTFRFVKDVPDLWIKQHKNISAELVLVTSEGILQVKHIPELNLKLWSSNRHLLPVALYGIKHSEFSINCLRHDLPIKSKLKIKLVDKTNDSIVGIVKVSSSMLSSTDLSMCLVKQGVAITKASNDEDLTTDSFKREYHKKLEKEMKNAIENQRGISFLFTSPSSTDQNSLKKKSIFSSFFKRFWLFKR